MEYFQAPDELLQNLSASCEKSNDVNEFCELVATSLRPDLPIEALILFVRVDELNLELKAVFGKPYAKLDDGRFLKTHRKTPVADSVRLQEPQLWGDSRKMLLEYPDLVMWPKIMHSVIAIPLVENKISVAACVFIPAGSFLQSEIPQLTAIFTEISQMIYTVYLRERGL